VLENINIDDFTFFALMTHNYNYDKALLFELCQHQVRYIAMLGPKKKLERILYEYNEENRPLNDDQIASIHSPAGFDIGAETSEEIALSILAEIKAFVSNRQGNSLRYKSSSIHDS
jgi:xanthine dehydrogenase accessory factor